MAPVHQNEKPREKVSESALEKGRPGQPVPSPSPVPAADNCSQLNEIPAGNQHGEVPGHRGEDPDGTAAVPNESEAEELLAGASSPRVPEEKEDCEEPLGGEEPPGQEGGRIGDEEEEGHDRQRGEEKRAPGKDEKVHPVSGGSDPEACRREDTGRKIAVGCRIVPPAPAGRRFLARFRSAPKIELHLHLEGSIAPARPEDYADLARDLVRHLRRERIRHAEVYVSPAVVERIGLPWPPVREALERVFSHHERSGCGSVLVLLDSVRQWGPGAAHRVLDLEERSPWRRAAGFGLGGDEGSVPARDFAGVYARVRRLGLAPTVHAGEWGGPDSVAEALRWLRPVRIAHGIRAAEDRALMRLLARRGVACDVCPTSNVVTGALPSIAEVARRVSALLGAGVTVTLSTDDPGLFGTTLLREFRTLASEGLPEATLAALARGSRAAALSATGPSRRR
jgi:adenosine deaminase